MKQIAQDIRSGKTMVLEVPVPKPGPGILLIRNAASLVSAGTERMVVEFAAKSMIGKAQSRPDLVRQTLNKARREGLLTTVDAVQNRLNQPMALGYSSAGTVIAAGEGVTRYRPGDRVACAGGGYAVHAEYVIVPENLLALLPDNVAFESGAFATLGAIALHGFRLAQPQVGERVVVIGLGLVGLLAVEIAQAAGCKVFGVDLDPTRVELARNLGAKAVIRDEAAAAASSESSGEGFDIVLICADTSSSDPIELAGAIARDRARIVAVGAVGMDLPRKVYYSKELTFMVSRSYGPGRYDHRYEEEGIDYPIGYIRWTEGRNLEAIVQMMAAGRLDVQPLISHRFPVERGIEAYDLITGKKDEAFLGVLLTYPQAEQVDLSMRRIRLSQTSAPAESAVCLGAIGAGNFATAVLFPALRHVKKLDLVGLATATGIKSAAAGRRFGFRYATTDYEEILKDSEINAIAILTRHYMHAGLILEALKAEKHVYCEKPLALNRDELMEIAKTLSQTDRLLTVGYNRRFAPLAVRMKAFLRSVHEPLMMHYRVNAGYLPPDHWLIDPHQGGGRIIGEGCHFIDFLTFLAGAPPLSVITQGLPDAGRYHEDNVVITIKFADGSIGTISYQANGDRAFPKERVEVFGGGRVAVLDDFRSLELVAGGQRQKKRSILRQDKGFQAQWEAFIAAIQAGGPPTIPYDQLFAVTLASFAAVESLRSGKSVKVEPIAIE